MPPKPVEDEPVDMTGSDTEREEYRLNELVAPLFDLYLRFQRAFGRLAIDRFDISDADAEAFARVMDEAEQGTGTAAGFAVLLRSIRNERALRVINHRVSAIWAAQGEKTPLSMDDINREYAKLGEGKA